MGLGMISRSAHTICFTLVERYLVINYGYIRPLLLVFVSVFWDFGRNACGTAMEAEMSEATD